MIVEKAMPLLSRFCSMHHPHEEPSKTEEDHNESNEHAVFMVNQLLGEDEERKRSSSNALFSGEEAKLNDNPFEIAGHSQETESTRHVTAKLPFSSHIPTPSRSRLSHMHSTLLNQTRTQASSISTTIRPASPVEPGSLRTTVSPFRLLLQTQK